MIKIIPLLILLTSSVTFAGEVPKTITGPVEAKVISVYDADTFTVHAYPWPDTIREIKIRLNGLDTPEKGHRAKCDKENELSVKAKKYVEGLILNKIVLLKNIKNGKYAGRVVAEVYVDGADLTALILGQDMAVVYNGGKKTKNWCSD